VVNGRKSTVHTDRQMATLIRHALAEVCTVPVFLVIVIIMFSLS